MRSISVTSRATEPTMATAASMYRHHAHHAANDARRLPVAPHKYSGSTSDMPAIDSRVRKKVRT